MKKSGGALLVIGGGMLFLVPATYLMRLADVTSSERITLWLFGSISVLLGGLLTRIANEQSLRLLGQKVVGGYKAMAILTLNALVLCAGLELVAFTIRSLRSSPPQLLV